MKAIVRDEYGPPEVLRFEEVETPSCGDDELLVRVHASSLSASDWECLTGSPLYARMWGPFKPRLRILGSDFAGRVEAVGRNVTQFRPGDEVFGDSMSSGTFGAFAEYLCVPQSAPVLHKPAHLNFEAAATLPQAGAIALKGIRTRGNVQPGQEVLIVGAGGSAGTFAIQLAKRAGARVTGVDNGEKLDVMRAAGADHVIDYTREDFSRNGGSYDLILDVAAHRSIFACKRALRAGGTYLAVGGSMSSLLQLLTLGPLLSPTGKTLRILGVNINVQALAEVVEVFTAEKIEPIIDKRYTLEGVPEAIRYLGEGHARGKVVISVAPA